MEKYNYDKEKYSSKIKRVIVSLPNFVFFHKPSSEDSVDERRYIGRKDKMKQLEQWLKDDHGGKRYSGSYLVTGYRGMGKSSFVGKVLSNIVDKNSTLISRITMSVLTSLPLLIIFLPSIENNLAKLIFLILALLIISIIAFYCFSNLRKSNNNYISVNLNLGSEISGERDILSLIANSLKSEIEIYKKTKKTNLINDSIKKWSINLFVVLFAIILHSYIFIWINNAYINWINNISDSNSVLCFILNNINDYLFQLRMQMPSILLTIVTLIVSFILYHLIFIKLFINISAYFVFYRYTAIIVIKKLNKLIERIESAINEDQDPYGQVTTSVFGITIKQRRIRNYQPATVREIEQELINIIKDAGEFIHIIIVLDELDKINPNKIDGNNKEKNDKDLPEFGYDTGGFPGGLSARVKKQNVLFLLAQMKYFITTAQAKFIFIAGRELYDAYLADMSDREFSISSMFDGEINIDSFLTCESNHEKDITAMTERYLSNLLLSENWVRENYILDNFKIKLSENSYKIDSDSSKLKKHLTSFIKQKNELNKLLKEKNEINTTIKEYKAKIKRETSIGNNIDNVQKKLVKSTSEIRDYIKDFDKEIEKSLTLKLYYEYLIEINLIGQEKLPEKKREEIEKTLMLLYQFVTYLTYVSNGAPKKITTHLEKYIKTNPKTEGTVNISTCQTYKSDYYLSFGYREQQKIGFIHYLAFPVFQTIINQASEYNDRLLISASFLISHIYKHHSQGFSWRDIEYTPELLDQHRTPELRDFINSMIGVLKQLHLSPITCGLYHLKFLQRISEEISMMSKMDDEISAVFNFSLDDSHSVKLYYAKMLKYYRQDNQSSHHTLANLHTSLGDLFAADEEYSKAISEYRNAIKQLSINSSDRKSHLAVHAMTKVRTMLKLGLVYEKRHTIDSAYQTYTDIINLLIDVRYIDEKRLNLRFEVEDTHDWREKNAILIREKSSKFSSHGISEFERIVQPRILSDKFKENIEYWVYGYEIIPKLSNQLTPEKASLVARLAMFEDLRLAYLPSLAKLFTLEKMGMGGITLDNLDIIESEFKYLHLATNMKQRYIIGADFFRKLGDIIYYKNGFIQYKKNSLELTLRAWGINIGNIIYDFIQINKVNMAEANRYFDFIKADYSDYKEVFEFWNKNGKKTIISNKEVTIANFTERFVNFCKKTTKEECEKQIKKNVNKELNNINKSETGNCSCIMCNSTELKKCGSNSCFGCIKKYGKIENEKETVFEYVAKKLWGLLGKPKDGKIINKKL